MHIHAEGPAFFCWIPKLFGKRVISTIHGLDWAREKWKFGVGSKFIRQGEKNAVKYADEIIVLSKGVQKYFMETYGRETHFIPNGYHNLGDDFILYSLLKSLDRAAKLEAGVKEPYQVSVISNGDDYQELFKKFHNISCKIIPERKFRKLHKRIELIKCDYWIIGGGGLFPDENAANFPSLLSSIQFAKKFNAKLECEMLGFYFTLFSVGCCSAFNE